MMTYAMPLMNGGDFSTSEFLKSRNETKHFRQKVGVFAENTRYYLESAQTSADLIDLFKLRFEVFFGNAPGKSGLDYDHFDWTFDHLTIREKSTGDVCGTYRICSQDHTDKFYSEDEFEMSELVSRPGNKIEIGRACIRDEHRNGLVLDLLWRGIGQYIQKTDATLIFGCSSIMSISSLLAHELADYFKELGCINPLQSLQPKAKYRALPRQTAPGQYSTEDLKSTVPPLVTSYLRAGATFGAVPAIDLDFGSIDFLTILDVKQMHPGYQKRYVTPLMS